MSRGRRWSFILGFSSFAAAWLMLIAETVLSMIDTQTHWFGTKYAVRIDGGTVIVWRYFSRWIVIDFPQIAAPVFGLSGIICLTTAIVCYVQDFAARRERVGSGFEVITHPSSAEGGAPSPAPPESAA